MATTPQIKNVYIGAPMWAMRPWAGTLYRRKTAANRYLPEYASVLNTVEGNHTFYNLPNAETVQRWRRDTPEHFRFCFKFPRSVTHDTKLGTGAVEEAQAFFRIMEPLADRTALLFLQLPPSFSAADFERLQAFVPHLSEAFQYAVEVRHLDYYRGDDLEKAFVELLEKHGLNYAMFDTATLHAIKSDEPAVKEAQRKKPKMPQRRIVTGDMPWLRYVGQEDVASNEANLSRMAVEVADWIAAGKTPAVFMHSPGDLHVPALCRRFHELLGKWADVGEMPAFPGELEREHPEQLDLF